MWPFIDLLSGHHCRRAGSGNRNPGAEVGVLESPGSARIAGIVLRLEIGTPDHCSARIDPLRDGEEAGDDIREGILPAVIDEAVRPIA